MNKNFRKLDLILIFAFLFLFLVGVLSIYSSTYDKYRDNVSKFFYKQIIWLLVGIVIILILMKIGTRKFLEWSYFLYMANLILLIGLFFIGVSEGGSHRWLRVGPISIQPSEFAKLSMLLLLVRFLGDQSRESFKLGKSLWLLLILGLPMLLIAKQPDLGTSLVLVPIMFAVWYVSGLGRKYFWLISILGIICSPFLWMVLEEYQKQRLLVFIKPELDPLGAGYTVIQSRIAIGSGKILGKGWLSGTQNMLNFLPERHTDFIFSVVGEEWGFLGALLVLGAYIILLKRGLNISLNSNNRYDKMLAVGSTVLLGLHVVINVGMTMGIVPAVGLPLPFISYGGSNLIVSMICLGFLLDIKKRTS